MLVNTGMQNAMCRALHISCKEALHHVTSLLCRISETPAALHAPTPGWRMLKTILIKCSCVSYCDDSRRTNWNVSQLPPCTDSLTSDCSANQTPSIHHPPIHKHRTSMHTLSWHQPKVIAWGNWQCCVQSKHCMCTAALPTWSVPSLRLF